MRNSAHKIIKVSLLGAALVVMSGCSGMLNSITLELEDNQELLTNKTILISVDTKPFDVKINPNSISITGGESWVENGYINFKATEPGDYQIFVAQNDVESNVLTIPVTGSSNPNAPIISQRPDDETSSDHNNDYESPIDLNDPILDSEYFTVDQVYDHAGALIIQSKEGREIEITGDLPQAAMETENGEQGQVLWNTDHTQYIILEGFPVPFGSCAARATGLLSRNEAGELVLTMSYIAAENPAEAQY